MPLGRVRWWQRRRSETLQGRLLFFRLDHGRVVAMSQLDWATLALPLLANRLDQGVNIGLVILRDVSQFSTLGITAAGISYRHIRVSGGACLFVVALRRFPVTIHLRSVT